MHITGIIAEYNPLHSGHIHHILETKRKTNTDYIVTILSGDFVQRGLPAIMDKFARTKTALLAGSDLVIELPSRYALSSAEGFAFGGVSLLNALNCIDTISFGSEAGDLVNMQQVAKILTQEPPAYSSAFKQYITQGLNFPSARKSALEDCYETLDVSFLNGKSNNLLGLEYCKALYSLNSSISPCTILRSGDSYHSEEHLSSHPSATHIRRCLEQNTPLPTEKFLPNYVRNLLLDKHSRNELLFLDDFSAILQYKLWSLSPEQYIIYQDVTPALANKIANHLTQFTTFTEFANLLWSKDLTYARVCRCLMYLLLEIKKDTWNMKAPAPYARILGFKKESAPLLAHIKRRTDIPLVSKLADAHTTLNADAYNLLEENMKHTHIYDSVRSNKSKTSFIHEMKKQIVLL